MKRVVIIRSAGNELANQLWNYASAYAYALDRACILENPAFFEYRTHFTMPAPRAFLPRLFSLPFRWRIGRKSDIRRRLWRKLYTWYSAAIMRAHHAQLISYASPTNVPYYLPPTQAPDARLDALERQADTVYLDGWLFRNPEGLKKYREQIRTYFAPHARIQDALAAEVAALRGRYTRLVGVQIRQGDYATWRNGAYFIPQPRVREILDEFLATNGWQKETTCFVLTSDGPIDTAVFEGLTTHVSRGNAVHDLFLLAETDTVFGANSTFGAFAAYYGDVPFVVMQRDAMDWTYYRGKDSFFENKYSTMVGY